MFLLRMMLREEYRMHVSYSSARVFLSLPVFVFVITLLVSLSLHNLEGAMSLEDLIVNVNAGVFLYGLSVGALGFLGKTYVERRQGKHNFLIALPSLLPLSYRGTFLRMFLRDALFYLVLMLLPALLGMLASLPLTRFSPGSVLVAFSVLALSFLYGLSLSFAVSVIGTRSRSVFGVIVGSIFALLLGYGVLGLYGMEAVLPTIGIQESAPPLGGDLGKASAFLALTVAAILVLGTIAVRFVAESYEGSGRTVRELLPTYFSRTALFRTFRPLVAKELVDLRRSGAVGKMTFTFVAPLTFLSFTTWYVNNGLDVPVGFNTVFYAAMVGFFGIMLYTWLTNLDTADYYETLPLDVPQLIRTKLVVFFLLTLGISTTFVIGIAALNGELRLLWLALPVLYVTSVYMVVATSYLTGLNPNSFLFNPAVLSRFVIVSIVPDIGLTVLSFSVDRSPVIAVAGILGVLGVLLVCSLLFYRRLDDKWGGRGFN